MSKVFGLLFNWLDVFVVIGVLSVSWSSQPFHSLMSALTVPQHLPPPALLKPECLLGVALLLGAHGQQHRGHWVGSCQMS